MTETWVLGSNHNGAKNCVQWKYPFPDFANADILIVNMGTLRPALKEDPALKNELFNQAQKNIFDMLMTSEKQIVIIMPSTPSALTWLPIYPDCRRIVPTKTEKTQTNQAINEYLENVENTSYYFHSMKLSFLSETKPKSANDNAKEAKSSISAKEYYSTKMRRTIGILNAAKQIVGGSFELSITLKQTYLDSIINEQHWTSSLITFLPPPTKVSVVTGIDLLINMAREKNQETVIYT
jgi:hypothetical protein